MQQNSHSGLVENRVIGTHRHYGNLSTLPHCHHTIWTFIMHKHISYTNHKRNFSLFISFTTSHTIIKFACLYIYGISKPISPFPSHFHPIVPPSSCTHHCEGCYKREPTGSEKALRVQTRESAAPDSESLCHLCVQWSGRKQSISYNIHVHRWSTYS